MIRLLFQGDSITDAGRDRSDFWSLGEGYPKYAAEYIFERFADTEFEFINRGVGGDQTEQLLQRMQEDIIDLKPDVVSVLIGINDVWWHAGDRNWLSDDKFESNYRKVLEGIKSGTDAKIMIMEPFLIPVEDKLFFREDLYKKIEIVRKLAREYADIYLPTDGLLNAAFVGDDPLSFAADGVHPTAKGAEFIGRVYCDAIAPLLERMGAE